MEEQSGTPALSLLEKADLTSEQALATEQVIDLESHQFYENRELSHLKFNLRVLHQARNPAHPLLERLMFLRQTMLSR